MEKVVLNKPYVKVVYDTERQIGKILWSGNPKEDEYKVPFQALLDWAHAGNPVPRFLSDTRKQGVVSPQYRKWFENEMIPAAIEAGLQRSAAITGGNVFKRYYLNMILSAVNKFNIPFKIFGDEESALQFLMSK